MKQVVIATDGSPPAQEVVEVGLELAKEQGADVTFVHDSPPDEFRAGGSAPCRWPTVSRWTSPRPRSTRPRTSPTRRTPTSSSSARAAEALWRRPLLGSVSPGVMRHGKRPVLVVQGARAPVEAAG